MNDQSPAAPSGRVASLHLHPPESGAPLLSANTIELITGKGILGDNRYFARLSRSAGEPGRRQVSLMAREQISKHAVALGLQTIPPGAVRANIETLGIDLVALIGQHVSIGGAVLHFYEARTPCMKMDAICVGLRKLMEDQNQGVMAEVIRPGCARVGDSIRPVNRHQTNPQPA
jgi:MOSC domain-containing protein YiiM